MSQNEIELKSTDEAGQFERRVRHIFNNPTIGQKVKLKKSDGTETVQRIVAVTEKTIRVSSCNLLKFTRSGALHKKDSQNGKLTISPLYD